VTPGEPQVNVTGHSFTFDAVYAPGEAARDTGLLFTDCVASLVDSVLQGWNATVLAYGQTGSGKTFTMGTAPGAQTGVIPSAAAHLFNQLATGGGGVSTTVQVSFVEMYQEEIRDLLTDNAAHSSQCLTLRDVPGSAVSAHLPDARLVTCTTPADVATVLARGAACRVTAATGMNAMSSRSHAVVTLHVTRTTPALTRRSKLHLVDLAGSERVKRTGAEGHRFAEGIHINRGLLALGNVISALGDVTRRGGHVPYRDSKLTRLLADALGGNSRTLFLACVSPVDTSSDETVNTLKYANRARNITNKAARDSGSLNSEATAEEVRQLRAALAEANAEVARLRGVLAVTCGGSTAMSLVDASSGRSLAEALARAQRAETAMQTARTAMTHLKTEVALAQQEATQACVARDMALMRLQCLEEEHGGGNNNENDAQAAANVDVLAARSRDCARLTYRVRQLTSCLAAAGLDVPMEVTAPLEEDAVVDGDGEEMQTCSIEEAAEAAEYESKRAECAAQLDALDAALSASEAEHQQLVGAHGQSSVADEVVAHYEQVLAAMETERAALLDERTRLLGALGDMNSASASVPRGPSRQGNEAQLRSQLRTLESKLEDVQRKLRSASDAESARKAIAIKEAALAAEVKRLKTARAELARRMERDAKAHAQAAKSAALALHLERAATRKAAAKAAQAGVQAEKAEAVLRRKMEEVAAAQKTIAALRAARRVGGASSGEAMATACEVADEAWMQAALAAGPASGWNNVHSLAEARQLLAAMAAGRGSETAIASLAPPPKRLNAAPAATAAKPRPRVRRQWRNLDEPGSDEEVTSSNSDVNVAMPESDHLPLSVSASEGIGAISSADEAGLATFLRAEGTPKQRKQKRPPFRLAETPQREQTEPALPSTPVASEQPACESSVQELLASARSSRQRAASLLFAPEESGHAPAQKTPGVRPISMSPRVPLGELPVNYEG